MKRVLVTGACGFTGARVIARLLRTRADLEVTGIDNFSRPGSPRNQEPLRALGVRLRHADVRCASDFDSLPEVDWVIDAAANPSVLAGVDGAQSGRRLLENNLWGTVNMLEFCRQRNAGFILLSSSRVYSLAALNQLPLQAEGGRFRLQTAGGLPPGLSAAGVAEGFSSEPPVSLYGASKRCSEQLALEYGSAFGFPVWINRCGLLAGAGQFGRPDQGIAAYWIHSWRERQPLRFLGFGGHGWQVRDLLHPEDLADLLDRQMQAGFGAGSPRVLNVGGGLDSSFSLAELTAWCADRFGPGPAPAPDGGARPMDVPWLVLDAAQARRQWSWAPQWTRAAIFEEIAAHAEQHPGWLALAE